MTEATTDAPHAKPSFLLTLSCPDRVGVVADVARFLVENDCNILESAQFGDAGNRQFYLRTAFEPMSGAGLAQLRVAFAPIAAAYGMRAEFFDQRRKTATIIMVSKFGHCLNDLLFRWR